MATLVLAAGGAALGAAVGGSISFLGATITTAAIGQAIGAAAGSYVDNLLFGSSGQPSVQDGSRLSDLSITASTEGTNIFRVYGRYRIGGQIIWATNHEEQVTTEKVGGKGLGGGSQTVTNYTYFANFAVGLCEGEITRIGRVWADGEEIPISDYTYRVYYGSETQTVDSLIEAKEGSNNAPAYRGLAYIVFERFPLADFGNRLPQLNFEVFRSVDNFENKVQAVTMIPAAGEFAYSPTEIRANAGGGTTYSENRHVSIADSDWAASIDQLEDSMSGCNSVSIFTAWFGDDLRCATCDITPKVDNNDKPTTTPYTWAVAGLTRSTASETSTSGGRPAFGGTPSDQSIIDALKDLKSRGFETILTPFLLMDIPESNGKEDPYTGDPDQPVYPWRGRITCDPAPGVVGTVDQTSTAGTQMDAFYGTVTASDYSVNPATEAITYTGPSEWSYSRFILHNAALCAAAGGVDAFVIGSEMRGVTWVRESSSSYPFVDNLIALAAEVKQIFSDASLTEPDVTYAADWSEYFGHQPSDGSDDVYFHLDDLWSDSNIDAIAIDNYWPLSDWRDGTSHLDYQAGTRSIYSQSYLKGNLQGGEGYDFYYASAADRDSQTRTTISDGAYSKPWVFRFKDVWNWWAEQHYNRPGGTESGSPTSWTPESKPIWFAELGCPAIDKGANQPNVFYDPKSSESFYPYYSRGTRDDLMQRSHLRAFLEFFDPSDDDFVTANNPVSGVYADRMVDISRIMIYTWDARPYPAFPLLRSIWSDGDNWYFGHWLTGRIGEAPVEQTVSTILDDYGFSDYSTSNLYGQMSGYIVDRNMSARQAIQPLELFFFFDSYESEGVIKFTHRGSSGSLATLTVDDLVETSPNTPKYELTRLQETEIPSTVIINYSDVGQEYEQATVRSTRLIGGSQQQSQASLSIAIEYAGAVSRAHVWLHETWTSRDQVKLSVPPSKIAYEISDVLSLSAQGRTIPFRIGGMTTGEHQVLEGKSTDIHIYDTYSGGIVEGSTNIPIVYGQSILAFMNLPLITGTEVAHAGRLAAFQSPWPGTVELYRAPNTSDYDLNTVISTASILGETSTAFIEGVTDVWDDSQTLRVDLGSSGTLSSASDDSILNGNNLMAIENADGEWELFQFGTATLVTEGVYDLQHFLRGQFGTEGAMRSSPGVAIGARVVLINATVVSAAMVQSDIKVPFNWKYGPGPYAIDDATYQTTSYTFEGTGLRPYSPVHVTGEFNSGDLDIAWIRRTRIGGDNWEITEIPLNEESESYEIDIYDGPTVVRTIAATTTSATYTAAQQTTDFGSPEASYTIRVYQISASFGRGQHREAIVP